MTTVWEHSTASGGDLLVLLAIADCANDEGIAWPSQTTLAAKARVTDRTIRSIVGRLVELGELAVVRQGGIRGEQRQSTVYRVTVTPRKDLPGSEEHPGSTDPGYPGSLDPGYPGSTLPPNRQVTVNGTVNVARASVAAAEGTEPSPTMTVGAALAAVPANALREQVAVVEAYVGQLTSAQRGVVTQALLDDRAAVGRYAQWALQTADRPAAFLVSGLRADLHLSFGTDTPTSTATARERRSAEAKAAAERFAARGARA